MPMITMPNGDRVSFPDNMTNDQIKSLIIQRFPDPAVHRGMLGQLWRGAAQGIMGSMMDIGPKVEAVNPAPFSMYPMMALNPSLANISGALQYVPRSKGADPTEEEKFVNEPTEGKAQDVGKIAGGMLPWLVTGPTGLIGDAFEAATAKGAQYLPQIAHAATHALAHKLPGALRRPLAELARQLASHPSVAQATPGIARVAGAIGQSIESRLLPLAMGVRQDIREPEYPGRYLNPKPGPVPKPEPGKKDLEDVKYVGTKSAPAPKKSEDGYVYYSR